MWLIQLSHHQLWEQALHRPCRSSLDNEELAGMQSIHRACAISSHPCGSHGKASCVLLPLVIYVHFLYKDQHPWLQRNKGSGEQTAGNGQMEEDLGQTNTIKLLLLPGHWKQNPRHLCEPAPWPAGYRADKNRVPTTKQTKVFPATKEKWLGMWLKTVAMGCPGLLSCCDIGQTHSAYRF